jgi:hypothetical protein
VFIFKFSTQSKFISASVCHSGDSTTFKQLPEPAIQKQLIRQNGQNKRTQPFLETKIADKVLFSVPKKKHSPTL